MDGNPQNTSEPIQLQQQLAVALRAIRAISECNQAIIHAQDEHALLQGVCEEIIKVTGYKLAWVGYAENNAEKTVKPVAQAGFEEGYLENIKVTWAEDQYGQGPTGLSLKTRKPATMQDIATNPTYAPWREQALKRGYQSSACFPFFFDNTAGTLCIYAPDPNTFGEEEVKLFAELAEDIAYGISAIRGRKEKLKIANQLQTILDSVSDGIFTLDHDFRYTYINDQGAIMVGRKSAKDLLGKLLFDEFPEAKGSSYDRLYHDAMDNKKVLHFEEYYAPLKKWHEGTIYPNPDGITIFFQEVTDRKLTEEKIRQANAYNRNLIETSLDPMLTINGIGKITDVNKAFEVATGVERMKLINTEVFNYFTDPQKVREGLEKTIHEGFIRDYRVAIKNASTNSILDCVWNTVIFKDEKGNVQGIFAAARDISQLKKTEKALQISEQKYKAYIDNTYDIIYALDKNGTLSYLSSRAKDYGVDPELLVGQKFEKFIIDEDRDLTLRTLQEGLQKRLRQI